MHNIVDDVRSHERAGLVGVSTKTCKGPPGGVVHLYLLHDAALLDVFHHHRRAPYRYCLVRLPEEDHARGSKAGKG